LAYSGDVTRLLIAHWEGDRQAFEQLLPAVCEDMHRITRAQLGRKGKGHTLQATSLVHEAYLRLVNQSRVNWVDRQHFLAVCARAIRMAHRARQRPGSNGRP
jgi:hypothetical protein